MFQLSFLILDWGGERFEIFFWDFLSLGFIIKKGNLKYILIDNLNKFARNTDAFPCRNKRKRIQREVSISHSLRTFCVLWYFENFWFLIRNCFQSSLFLHTCSTGFIFLSLWSFDWTVSSLTVKSITLTFNANSYYIFVYIEDHSSLQFETYTNATNFYRSHISQFKRMIRINL